jgi:hypothetical protein
MIKFIKMLAGLALLPACWGMSIAVYRLYQTSLETAVASGFEKWALPAGFLLWVVVFFLLPRPTRTYVLGHELTHALWSIMMGGRIGRIKVGRSGGHVELTKTNFIVTLAPYFFPFYTVFVIAAYYLCGIWLNMEPYRLWWLGAVGLTWSFHLTFTLHMLAEHQPDIHEHGRIFSYAVIYIMNLMVIGLWMLLVGDPTFLSFGGLLIHENAVVYNRVAHCFWLSWNRCMELIGSLR